MPKGFMIGQHIREITGTSKDPRTFGHTVLRIVLLKKWIQAVLLKSSLIAKQRKRSQFCLVLVVFLAAQAAHVHAMHLAT